MTRKRGPSLVPYQVVLGLSAASIAGVVALLGLLRDELDAGSAEVGLLVAAGFFASFVSQIAVAPLADRGYGARLVQVGLGLASLALLAMVVIDDVWGFVAARAVLGFALGMMVPGIRRVAAVLDPSRVGENLGRLIVGEVVGYIAGPVVAATLAEIGGLPLSFAALGVALAAFIPFAFALPPDRGRLASGSRLSLDLLRRPALVGALVLTGGYVVLIGAVEVVMPLQLTDAGYETWTIGVVFTAFALPVAATSPIGGRIADRIGPLRVAVGGMAVVCLVATLLGVAEGLGFIVLLVMMFGAADGFGFTAGQAVVSRTVPEERQSSALGLMGAAEVLVAGLVAAPAAVFYAKAGKEAVWLVAASTALATVLVGAWLVARSSSRASFATSRS